MAPRDEHILKAFDHDLDELRAIILDMGRHVEAATAKALDALLRSDTELAAEVIAQDQRVDELQQTADSLVIRLISLRAPVADDLREVIAAHKTAHVIERIGDHAKNIAKRVPVIAAGSVRQAPVLSVMSRSVIDMLSAAMAAFAARDADAAVAVCKLDREVDELFNSLFRTLLTYMMEDPHVITAGTQLLFVAKNLERIGDQATNIAEMTYYVARGEKMEERPRGPDLLSQP